jgi:hypothetical protein
VSRGAIVEAVLAQLREHYIDVAKLPAIEQLLHARQTAGDYDRIQGGAEFAQAMTRDLQSIGHSGHLNLRYRSQPLALQAQAPEAVERAAQSAEARRINYGLTRAEVLEGNIGYLRMDRFGDAEAGGRAVAGAMAMLANTDAMFLDLRANRGGGDLYVVLRRRRRSGCPRWNTHGATRRFRSGPCRHWLARATSTGPSMC